MRQSNFWSGLAVAPPAGAAASDLFFAPEAAGFASGCAAVCATASAGAADLDLATQTSATARARFPISETMSKGFEFMTWRCLRGDARKGITKSRPYFQQTNFAAFRSTTANRVKRRQPPLSVHGGFHLLQPHRHGLP